MEPQNNDRALFQRIYQLEALAESYLDVPHSTVTVATYRLNIGNEQYLFLENKSTGSNVNPSANSIETTVSLGRERVTPHSRMTVSTIRGQDNDTTLSGIISGYLWCANSNPEVMTFREQQAVLAVRGLWRALGAHSWKENQYHLALDKSPALERLSKQVVSSVLPLVGTGALFLHRTIEPHFDEGALYIEANRLTGDRRHSDSRYIGWPILRVRVHQGSTAYVYERTMEGEEETQVFPIDRRKRYQGFHDYTPQMSDEGLIPYPTLRKDLEFFEAQERAEGKYVPQRKVIDLILAKLQDAAA